jgi:hypothetical protein
MKKTKELCEMSTLVTHRRRFVVYSKTDALILLELVCSNDYLNRNSSFLKIVQ